MLTLHCKQFVWFYYPVLYLDEGVGGPTLVTDQLLGEGGLAQNGWLCFPKTNRLVLFDARYLHGVVPGRGWCSLWKLCWILFTDLNPHIILLNHHHHPFHDQEVFLWIHIRSLKTKHKLYNSLFLLLGVNPDPSRRRLTFMVGFWRKIDARQRERWWLWLYVYTCIYTYVCEHIFVCSHKYIKCIYIDMHNLTPHPIQGGAGSCIITLPLSLLSLLLTSQLWLIIYWKKTSRDVAGPSQPFPDKDSRYSWHKEMEIRPQTMVERGSGIEAQRRVAPQSVSKVWESVNDDQGSEGVMGGGTVRSLTTPNYNQCFQGFWDSCAGWSVPNWDLIYISSPRILLHSLKYLHLTHLKWKLFIRSCLLRNYLLDF